MQWQCLSLRKILDMVAKKISSGKSWIDTLLDGGYDRGKLYLVGGSGVCWQEDFLRQSAVDICMDSKGLLFSLEMSAESFCYRMIHNKVPHLLDTPGVSVDYIVENAKRQVIDKSIDEVVIDMRNLMLYIDDTPGVSVDYIVENAKRQVIDKSIDVVFIDMMNLIREECDSWKLHKQQLISKLSALAKELNIVVIGSLRVNKNLGIDGYRNLTDLKDLIYIESSPRDRTCLKVEYYVNMTLFSEALIKIEFKANYDSIESDMVFMHDASGPDYVYPRGCKKPNKQ